MLARMQAMPRLAVPVTVLALFLIGAFAPPAYAVAAVATLTLFVGWLATLSWPVLDRPARLVRVVVIVALLGLLVSRAVEATS